MTRFARRTFLAGLGAATAAALGSSDALGRSDFRELELDVDGATSFAGRALALLPEDLPAEGGLRLLVLLHGYFRSAPAERMIRVWGREYGAVRAHQRLAQPPIRRLYDTVRYLTDRRIRELDAELTAKPFRGMVLVCPVTPIPYFRASAEPLFDEYSRWIAERLLPEVQRTLPVSSSAADTGIAGASMGGQMALEVAIRHPELFGAVGGVQTAIEQGAVWKYARRIAAAHAKSGGARFQLLTSTRDPYVTSNRALHAALVQRGVPADLLSPFGPHNAPWMREVGSLELLRWMDRALGSKTALPPPDSVAETQTEPSAT